MDESLARDHFRACEYLKSQRPASHLLRVDTNPNVYRVRGPMPVDHGFLDTSTSHLIDQGE